MADIFLSYAREDRDRAEKLAHALESRGWSVWWDRRIQAGHSFAEVIETQLEAARCVVVLWTEHSINSNWVQNEASEGDHRTVLIPVRLDDVRIPLGFRHLQTADLLDWDGDQTPELAEFLSAVESKLGNPATAAAPVSRPAPPERKSRVGLITTIAVAAIALLGVLIAIATQKAQLTRRADTTSVETAVSTTATESATLTDTVTTTTNTTTTAEPPTTTTTAPPTTTLTLDPAVTATLIPPVTATQVRPDFPIRPLPTASTTTYVDLETSMGRITIECFTDRAGWRAAHFINLAKRRRLDGLDITRVAPGMFVQMGDDDSPIRFADENTGMAYQPGLLAFGNERQKDTQQFFIRLSRVAPSNQQYSWFGRVVRGMEVVDAISRLPVGRERRLITPIRIDKATVRTR